ncbi:MAG: hypothetical protein H5T95_09860 [Firmicutes bacterium]|nr:hypothetical protein [Bacillota bacterium]
MLSIYGEIANEDILKEALDSLGTPKEIDHIWVEVPEWVSDDEWEIQYRMVYGSEADLT